MKILVLNCGSSSLKYQLINMETEEVLASGKYERIGEDEAFITHKVNGQKIEIKHPAKTHEEAVDFTLKQLINPEYKVIDSLDEISAIGHRLVHGGEKINKSVIITDEVVEVLKECIDLAPLHNPAGIIGIEACKKVMPGKPMVGVFDTAFHQTMPKERYIYPIPYEYYKKYGIRKYGAHGTSHQYVANRVAEIIGKDIKDLTNQNITFKYNRKTYLEITNTNDYNDYKKLLKKLKISNDEVLQVIGNDSEQVLINDFSNTYLIGNSSKLLKSFKINKTSSNNLKGFEKVLRKKINKR